MTTVTSELPVLHPEELAEVRRITGRPDLTNDEAQIWLRESTEEGGILWLLDKKGI